MKCVICDSPKLCEVRPYNSLPLVTSDAKVWKTGIRLGACPDCGTAQKLVDRDYLSEVREIYSGYSIYYQSNGAEQRIFLSSGCEPVPRSMLIAEHLQKALPLRNDIAILDFGCGNGETLKIFSQLYDRSMLYGYDISDINARRLKSIIGFKELFLCTPEEIPLRFDLITLIHSLEHVIDPVSTISALTDRLADGGYLFIQVPDSYITPYDFVAADHRTHFTTESLKMLAERAGLQTEELSNSVISKEITFIARKSRKANKKIVPRETSAAMSHINSKLIWLDYQANAIKSFISQSNICGIFGTSISATWLYSSAPNRVSFFVDEDPTRIGREHMGLRIFSPAQIPRTTDLFIPLIPKQAASVASRLQSSGIRCHIPR